MKWNAMDNILMGVIGIAFFLNILLPYSLDMVPIIERLLIVGWIMLGIGMSFVVLSILTLRRRGTSRVVDYGVYGVVRHPMYLGGLIMFLSHVFFFQNWIVAINSSAAVICCYLLIVSEDQRNIKRFGSDYKRYMKDVPRMNFLSGTIRSIKLRKK
jgi:protein-S-isoprenylcysteine O-methyltransferase Ste14